MTVTKCWCPGLFPGENISYTLSGGTQTSPALFYWQTFGLTSQGVLQLPQISPGFTFNWRESEYFHLRPQNLDGLFVFYFSLFISISIYNVAGLMSLNTRSRNVIIGVRLSIIGANTGTSHYWKLLPSPQTYFPQYYQTSNLVQEES